jgi:hypothetical protein
MISNKKIMEMIMKKIFILVLMMIFLAAFGNEALAKERIVKLNIPGCNA